MPDAPRWIEYRPIDELPGNPRNAKDHDNDLIGASLERFGVIESCVLDERTGLLVGGHGRRDTFLAAYAAGEEPPEGVVVADDGRWTVPLTRGWASADDLEADAAAVALNQVGPVGGWIDDKLADILGDLAAGPGLDGVGFDHDDLDDLLGNGARVLDPFAGSGTIILAAEASGRIGYGIELSPGYVDVICRRYQAATGTLPILEATGEPHDFRADE